MKKEKKQRTKGEHYLPQKSYLDYFTDNSSKKSFCWVYEDIKTLIQDADKVEFKKITPFNFCKEIHMYETPTLPVNTIENTLATIEQSYNTVYQNKIIKGIALDVKDKSELSYFISSLEARTPAVRANWLGTLDQILEKTIALEQQHMNGKQSTQHKEILALKEKNIAFTDLIITSLEVDRWQFSDFLFVTPSIEGEDQFFLTSDHPVVLYDFTLANGPYGIPPLSSTIEIVVPLSPKITLIGNNAGVSGYLRISPNFVREVNNRIITGAYKYVISPKKLGKKYVDSYIQRQRQSFLLLGLSKKLGEDFDKRHGLERKNEKSIK